MPRWHIIALISSLIVTWSFCCSAATDACISEGERTRLGYESLAAGMLVYMWTPHLPELHWLQKHLNTLQTPSDASAVTGAEGTRSPLGTEPNTISQSKSDPCQHKDFVFHGQQVDLSFDNKLGCAGWLGWVKSKGTLKKYSSEVKGSI